MTRTLLILIEIQVGDVLRTERKGRETVQPYLITMGLESVKSGSPKGVQTPYKYK